MKFQVVCFASLLMVGWIALANGQDEEPPMREISSDEVTRFLAQPDEAEIDDYLRLVHKGENFTLKYYDTQWHGDEEWTSTLATETIPADSDGLILLHAKVSAKDFERLVEAAMRWKIEGFLVLFCVIEGDLNFAGKTFDKPIMFEGTTFEGEVHFNNTTFVEGTSFRYSTFAKKAVFANTTFPKGKFFGATFSEGVEFNGATFRNGANFVRVTFSSYANFEANFLGDTTFHGATFVGSALFPRADFSGSYTSFLNATLSGGGNFFSVNFSGRIRFEGAVLNDISFDKANFAEEANFANATFSGQTQFSKCQFEKLADFRGCLYHENSTIDFSGTTGFNQLVAEWEYDPQFNNEKNRDRNQRGLKGKFKFDETFYVALIKNYADMGWLKEADDAYYTYRAEKRKRLESGLRKSAELIFLEFPFGYGVKPLFLLRSFILVWIPFGWYYAFFLRHREKGTSPWRTRPFTRYEFWGFAWAFLHSLDAMAQGLEFHSLTDPFFDESPYQFRERKKAVINVQRFQQLLGWYLLALFLILFGKIWIR